MKLVFDIGYNKGLFTKECQTIFPDCHVVAVEANLNLLNNIRGNDKFTIINALVSDKSNEYVDFFIENRHLGISTASKKFMNESRFKKGSRELLPNTGQWNEPVKVQTVTLDLMVKKFGTPDLIKIDVEGYEYEVLKGLTKIQNKISFEWHEEDFESIQNCVNHLIGLGYNKFGIIGIFSEKNLPSIITNDDRGNPHMVEPNVYCSWSELEPEFKKFCKPDRRVNYGMLFAKY